MSPVCNTGFLDYTFEVIVRVILATEDIIHFLRMNIILHDIYVKNQVSFPLRCWLQKGVPVLM